MVTIKTFLPLLYFLYALEAILSYTVDKESKHNEN